MAKTLDQERATHAYESVCRVPPKERDEYFTEAKKLPARILTASLGPALAFLAAKSKTCLLKDLTDWVVAKRGMAKATEGTLLDRVIGEDALFLRRATEETLAYLQWLSRFAEAAEQGDADKKAGR